MVFKDLKVIDLSTVLAGPSVGMFFAELGAKVIKVESPIHPDVTRSWKVASENKESPVSAYFSSINYQKEYLQLDITDDDEFQDFVDLVASADVLLTNFKKSDLEKFRINDTFFLKINPRLILGKISGFGSLSDRVAYDLILQAESGFMSMNGTEESGPIKMPVALIDVLAAHQLKEGILCALFEREKTGKGNVVEVSLYDAAVSSLINQASTYLMTGKIPQRIGSKHPNIAPYGEFFKTKDNSEITFAIGSDSQFTKLLSYLNLSELEPLNEFSTNQNRVINRKQLALLLQEKISEIESEEILHWAIENHVPCGKIKSLDEVFEETQAQKLIREETIDGVETKRVTSVAFKTRIPFGYKYQGPLANRKRNSSSEHEHNNNQ